MRGFKIAHGALGQQMRGQQRACRRLAVWLAALPERVPVKAAIDEEEMVKLAPEAKHLTDTILSSSVDVIPDAQQLRIRPHSLANPRSNQALVQVCATLNALELKYPGTSLTLVSEAPDVA